MEKLNTFFKQQGYTDIESTILTLFYHEDRSSHTFFEVRKKTGLPKNILNRSLNHLIKVNEISFVKNEISRKRLFSIHENATIKDKITRLVVNK